MALVERKEHSYENEGSLGNLNPNVKPQIDLGNPQLAEGKNLPYKTLIFFFLHEVAVTQYLN